MRTVYLPENDSKGNKRVEKITNAKLLPPVKNAAGEEEPQPITFEIPAAKFGYPQYDTPEEATQACGSVEKFMEFFNRAVANAAVTVGKNFIRNATKSGVGKAGNYSDVIEAGLQKSLNFSPAIVEEMTTKEKANAFDTLLAAAKTGTMSNEELIAQLKKLSA